MSHGSRTPVDGVLGDERLVEQARRRRVTRPSARDLWTSGALGVAFLAAALGIVAALPWEREPSLLLLGLLVGAYAVLSRVELEVGPGSAVPTQLVFVPMLFMVPLPLVPLCVAGGYVLGALPDYLRLRVHPARSLVLLAGSWFAIGPTLVLALYAPGAPTLENAPVYAAALASQFGLDFVSAAARERIVFGHPLRLLLPSFAWVYGIDSLLAPVGIAAAASGPGAFLTVFPLAGLLALLARDRRVRIDRAVAFDHAYRDAHDEAHRDDLTGLANRRRLLADLDRTLSQADSGDDRLLVLYDLNGFKYYNDTFGHPAGDALLQQLGQKLADVVDGRGSAYRLGGDEFCVLADVSAEAVEAFLDATTAALTKIGDDFSVSTGFGAVLIPSEAADPESALRTADRRLYAQKHAMKLGRGEAYEVLLEALCARDPEMRAHVHGVARLSQAVGRRLGLSGQQLEELVLAAHLHDVGKIAIPDVLLHKPGCLDEAEWALMRQHTVIGQRILGTAPALRGVGAVVRATHERWDGRGYEGFVGTAIPLAARIIAVCDAFAAMTSDRAYRAAMTSEEALAELRRSAGTQFDPVVVRVFHDELMRVGTLSIVVADAA